MIANLVGKGGHVRTVPIPTWVKSAIDVWMMAAGITNGVIFLAINKADVSGDMGCRPRCCGMLFNRRRLAQESKNWPRVICGECALDCVISLAVNWIRFQFLLGHVSIQTTERYLGRKRRLRCAVNDHFVIEPDHSARRPSRADRS